jgi:regulator of sigma E protease
VPVFDDQPPVVGVVAAGSPAAEKDIRPGDRIVSVAGHAVDTWEQLFVAIESRSNHEVSMGLLRNGLELTKQITPRPQPGNSRFEIGDIGVLPNIHPHIKTLNPGEPADRAGMKPGDVIVAVDGHLITFSWQLREEITKHPGTPMSVSILRNGAAETLQVLPDKHGDIGWLGILPADETKSIKPGPIEAVTMSVQKNAQFAQMILQTVWGLLTLETSPKQLMGPVAIAQLSGESAQLGFLPLMMLMASISLNLGLLNLMPVPVLDGGHIFIMAIEGLVKRDFSQRVKEKMLLAGFVVLMMLMVTVIYNDLSRISWIGRLMPWK